MSSSSAPSTAPWDNPMGTDGFEFIEYAAPDPVAMGALFERMGFSAVAGLGLTAWACSERARCSEPFTWGVV